MYPLENFKDPAFSHPPELMGAPKLIGLLAQVLFNGNAKSKGVVMEKFLSFAMVFKGYKNVIKVFFLRSSLKMSAVWLQSLCGNRFHNEIKHSTSS